MSLLSPDIATHHTSFMCPRCIYFSISSSTWTMLCEYIYIYIYIYIYMYVCICIYVCIQQHTCLFSLQSVCFSISSRSCVCVCIYTYIHIHVCVNTRAHIAANHTCLCSPQSVCFSIPSRRRELKKRNMDKFDVPTLYILQHFEHKASNTCIHVCVCVCVCV